MNWNFIIDRIRNRQSVLFLGPDVQLIANEQNFHSAVCQHLLNQKNLKIKHFDPVEQFFFFDDEISRLMACTEIRTFYEQHFDLSLYEKIALLPFPVVATLNPDMYLKKAFDKLGLAHQFAYYKQRDTSHIKPPELDLPLIYNLFGSIESDESLMLTYDDLFDFVERLMQVKSIPKEFNEVVRAAQNIIFLGFRFNHWLMQILLRYLNPERKKYQIALQQDDTHSTSLFFLDQFKLQFYPLKTNDFVQQLYDKCTTAGLIRSPKSNKKVSEQVLELIEAADPTRALSLMSDFVQDKDPELYNDIVLLRGQLSSLQRRINKNIIEPAEATRETNKICDAILNFNKELISYE